MENKGYKERLEGRELDRWWRWIEYERGRDFQYDLFDKNKLVDEERLRDKSNKENSISFKSTVPNMTELT